MTGPEQMLHAILPYLAHLPESKRAEAVSHLSGVAQSAVLLAAARGLDPKLAALAGWLHDVYSYATGIRLMHDVSGAECARVIIERHGWCSESEAQSVCRAIMHHSNKEQIDGPYEELLKDADILARLLANPAHPFSTPKLHRIRSMMQQLGLTFDPVAKTTLSSAAPAALPLAPAARHQALLPIRGDMADARFVEMIRYWPEPEAPQELVGQWCAAFVYHLCMTCNRPLPIRAPGVSLRFSCVAAWVEYARIHGLLRTSGQPHPGDIVILNLQSPADHMGVFLGPSQNKWETAEGNLDGLNVSGLGLRDPSHEVFGFFHGPGGL